MIIKLLIVGRDLTQFGKRRPLINKWNQYRFQLGTYAWLVSQNIQKKVWT